MNIFALSAEPQIAATMLCDKHVCKMAVESAQMLCTAVLDRLGEDRIPGMYEPTHVHHPCTLWAGESIENFVWLAVHGLEICHEFERRFGHSHATKQIISKALAYQHLFDRVPQTPFVQCMPDQYKDETNPVTAYRRYYLAEKARFATWKRSSPPYWWTKV